MADNVRTLSILRLGAIGEVMSDEIGFVHLDDEVGGDLQTRARPLGWEVGGGSASELHNSNVLTPAFDIIDARDAVRVARDQ